MTTTPTIKLDLIATYPTAKLSEIDPGILKRLQQGYSLVLVPLCSLSISSLSRHIVDYFQQKISKEKSVRPILISAIDGKEGAFRAIYGSHRTLVCKKLGYTHIPAMVEKGAEHDLELYH
jgi:hypothetical protein